MTSVKLEGGRTFTHTFKVGEADKLLRHFSDRIRAHIEDLAFEIGRDSKHYPYRECPSCEHPVDGQDREPEVRIKALTKLYDEFRYIRVIESEIDLVNDQ